jgi:hypothetical protein
MRKGELFWLELGLNRLLTFWYGWIASVRGRLQFRRGRITATGWFLGAALIVWKALPSLLP